VDAYGETDPILASWHYGNGRVLAFAAHGAGSSVAAWMSLPEYALLWTQAVRHFLPSAMGPGVHVRFAQQQDGQALLYVDWLDARGMPRTGESVLATLREPNDLTVELVEREPGRYVALLEAVDAGLQEL